MVEVLTLYPLAERLRLSADWLREQADAGRLPHIRAGNRYVFNPAAVTAALAQLAAQFPPPRTDGKAVTHVQN